MSTGEAEKVTLPETIGPFRILRFIGRGGMGIVYEADGISDGQRVAVKTVAVNSAGLLGAIRVEVAALKAIRHPGVIRILEDGLDEGAPWYSMEILDGRSLAQLIRETWRGTRPEPVGDAEHVGEPSPRRRTRSPTSGDDSAPAAPPVMPPGRGARRPPESSGKCCCCSAGCASRSPSFTARAWSTGISSRRMYSSDRTATPF